MIFGRDMIILIKHTVYWELICQQKQTKMNKDNICEYIQRVDYDYKVGDDVMLTKHTAYEYETPYTGPFVTTRCCINGTVSIKNWCNRN